MMRTSSSPLMWSSNLDSCLAGVIHPQDERCRRELADVFELPSAAAAPTPSGMLQAILLPPMMVIW